MVKGMNYPTTPVINLASYQKPLSNADIVRATLRPQHNPHLTTTLSVIVAAIWFSVLGTLIAISDASNGLGSLAFLLGIITFFAIIPGIALFSRKFRRIERRLRLQQFSADNGFAYTEQLPNLRGPGFILDRGKDGENRLDNIISGTFQGLPFRFGNFFYRTNNRTFTEASYGVIQVRLPRHLPHIVLDGKQNNVAGLTNLAAIRHGQHFALEGDFQKYFNLYVPKGYERDALYFITPDLMQLLITYGAQYDIEIIDDTMLIYCKQPYRTENANAVRFIFEVIGVIGAKVERNTQRYADERVGDRSMDIVSQSGRRLKVRQWTMYILIAYALFYFVQMLFSDW